MALVPYESRIAEYKDWLEAKRRWNDDVWANDWILPSPTAWANYRSLCTPNGYLRPWVDSYYGDLNCVERDVKVTRDVFQVQLDVRHFKSYEIDVRVVGNSIVIKGKHDKRPKVNGYIERQCMTIYNFFCSFSPILFISLHLSLLFFHSIPFKLNESTICQVTSESVT